jgi:hypothetical protein
VYSARTTPPDFHEAQLQLFDDKVRSTFCSFSGVQMPDDKWEQATRGFDFAGLGLRKAAHHAPAAFLSSALSTRVLCTKLDPAFVWEGLSQGSDAARSFALLNSKLLPEHQVQLTGSEPQCFSQKHLSKLLDSSDHQRFLLTLSHADRENVLSECRPGASGFLSVVPSKEAGGAMDPAEFVVELKARLSLDELPSAEFCPLCDGVEDPKCRHSRGLCVAGPDRNLKHNSVRNTVGRFAGRAALNPEVEKAGLLPPGPDEPSSNLRRPADVYLPSWKNGSPAALDFAGTSPHRLDALARTAAGGESAAEAYTSFKRNFQNTAEECRRQGILFVPMVFEPSGAWAPDALRTLRELANISARRSGAEQSAVLGNMLQSLCVVIRTASARAVLRRRALAAAGSEDPLLAARQVLAIGPPATIEA